MRRRLLLSGVFVVGISGLFAAIYSRPTQASDHKDSPSAVADPVADITDVYTFMRPAGDGGVSNHAVFVMNVQGQGPTPAFSDHVLYTFQVQRVATLKPLTFEPTDYHIDCTFANAEPQVVTCNIPGIGPVLSEIDKTDAGESDDVRIFAGLRSDPAFGDIAKIKESVATGTSKLANPGTNAFAGANVLSLVLEVNVAKAFNFGDAGSATPILAVAGETVRR